MASNERDLIIRMRADIQDAYNKLNILNNRFVQFRKQNAYQLNAMRREMKNSFSAQQQIVTNYGSSIRNIGSNISGYLTGMFSIVAAQQFAASIVNTTREVDSLDKSLKIVTGSSEQFQKAQMFIREIAEVNGQEINGLTKEYIKYYAATKTSGLSTDELNGIFARITKSSAILGNSMDDTSGALRAIIQMFSKGIIQSEELRGQLSERLSGAYTILAKSMGLTEKQLGKQLELGNVMAKDVLPKFAEEYEKAVGADQVQKIETLNSTFGRFKTAWQEWIRDIDEGKGTVGGFLSVLIGGLTDIMKFLGQGNFWKSFEEESRTAFDDVQKLMDNLKSPRLDAKKWTKVYIDDVTEAFRVMNKRSGDSTETLRNDFEVVRKKLYEYRLGLMSLRNPTERNAIELQKVNKAISQVEVAIKRSTQSEREAIDVKRQLSEQLDLKIQKELEDAAALKEATEAARKKRMEEAAAIKQKRLEQFGVKGEIKGASRLGTPFETIRDLNTELSRLQNMRLDASVGEIGKIDAAIQKTQKSIEEFGGTNEIVLMKMPEHIRKGAEAAQLAWKEFQDMQQQRLDSLNAIVDGGLKNILAGSIESFATTLGDGGGLKRAFASIVGVIGGGLQQMGGALIAWGVGLETLFESLKKPGRGAALRAVAVGVGMVALGSFLKASSARAMSGMSKGLGGGGGGDTGGGRGFSGTATGQSVVINGEFRVRGTDLVLALNNQQRIDNRSRP